MRLPLEALALLVFIVATAAAVIWIQGLRLDAAAAQAAQLRLEAAVLEDQRRVSEEALESLRGAEARVRTVTREVLREIPVRVPADACPLPDAWRVLHDSAAAGALPRASAGPDGAASAPPAAASR